MGKKWERWKEKLNNILFEEVEVDDEEDIPNQYTDVSWAEREVHTKMTYQYPNKSSFRFPVIPDESSAKEEIVKEPFIPAKMHAKRRTSSKRRPYRAYKRRDSNYQKYQQTKQMKEIENIPAFMRRELSERQKEPRFEEEKDSFSETQNMVDQVEKKETFHHSTPDELDRVFKKQKSQPLLKRERQDRNYTYHRKEKNISLTSNHRKKEYFPSNNLARQRHHSKEQQIESREAQCLSEGKRSQFLHDVVEDPTRIPMETETLREQEEYVESVPNYLLNDPLIDDPADSEWLEEQQQLLEQTLINFKIAARVVNVTQGPSVTRFEIQPDLGVKVSRIRNLADDLKLNLSAKEIRIEAPIPGRNTVGIEIPNQFPQTVTLQEIIETDEFVNSPSPLTIALGLTIEGNPLITNIGKMPHGLIAGATGSGKSVCINTILISLLYKASFEEVKFLLIDPKMVELAPYNGIPHLVAPVITDTKAATAALKWAVKEMEARYEEFVEAGVRNIEKYNEKMEKGQLLGEKMPFLVIVIDELADLMMVSPQDVEDSICRIAQKARACGIHLLLATQRPSVDVITGLIKANIPTRIAFTVSSQVDSRTILDSNGAEKLLGKGDMLFIENGSGKSLRLQGPFVSDEEINRVTSYMRSIAKPNYLFEQEQLLMDIEEEEEDDLLNDVILFVIENNQASTSLLQRQFRIGYNRAARLIDSLYSRGVISAQNGSKPREVLVSKAQINEYLSTK